jgi:hypothetical protein
MFSEVSEESAASVFRVEDGDVGSTFIQNIPEDSFLRSHIRALRTTDLRIEEMVSS